MLLFTLAMTLATAPATRCPGIVLRDGGRSRCAVQPPLIDRCTAVRACRGRSICAVAVTGRLTATAFAGSEAWGDWLARIGDAPPAWRLKAATVEHLQGRAIGWPPYTVILAAGRAPLVGQGLFLDDLSVIRDYAATGKRPPGMRRAAADTADRICPRRR